MPFAGGSPVKFINVPAGVNWNWASLNWTVDGSALAYSSLADSRIWMQPIAGGPAKELADFKPDRILYSDWSHDGKKLAVARGKNTSDVVLISNFK